MMIVLSFHVFTIKNREPFRDQMCVRLEDIGMLGQWMMRQCVLT